MRLTSFRCFPGRSPGRRLRRLLRARRGSVAAEFAMAVPVLVTIALAGTEVARYVLLHQKLARTAVTMGDLVTQAEEISETELTQLYAAVDHVMEPFSMGADGIVFVSGITATGGGSPQVSWQRTGGGGLTGAVSAVGAEATSATLPPSFVVRDGETAIVSEVIYEYSPLFSGGLLGTRTIYHRAMFRPRFGSLASLEP